MQNARTTLLNAVAKVAQTHVDWTKVEIVDKNQKNTLLIFKTDSAAIQRHTVIDPAPDNLRGLIVTTYVKNLQKPLQKKLQQLVLGWKGKPLAEIVQACVDLWEQQQTEKEKKKELKTILIALQLQDLEQR